MKRILCLFVGVASLTALSNQESPKKSLREMSQDERIIHREQATGGFVVKPNTQRGRIVFYNAQDEISATNINVVIGLFRADRNGDYNFVVEAPSGHVELGSESSYSDMRKKLDAAILVIIKSSDKSPAFVTAPEDGWSVLNVNRLADGLKGDAINKFLESRFRKELIRAVCYAVGTPSTQFRGNIFTVSNVRDLDHCPEMIPIDTMQATAFRLKSLGVMPSYKTTYRKACVDGWAPAPTNEFQKAIWDKVHAMPSEPIKIKPEAKKQAK